ncbi:hypothetical protein SH139x_004130 [Planctomycetaceae bacterium SH139]
METPQAQPLRILPFIVMVLVFAAFLGGMTGVYSMYMSAFEQKPTIIEGKASGPPPGMGGGGGSQNADDAGADDSAAEDDAAEEEAAEEEAAEEEAG